MAGVSSKLTSLVEAAEDSYTLVYAYTHLGVGVPNGSRGFRARVDHIRSQLLKIYFNVRTPLERLEKFKTEWERERQEVARRNGQERQMAVHLFQKSTLNIIARRLSAMKSEDLRKHFVHNHPIVRFLAIQCVGERHAHLEADLMARLGDLDPVVRETAHAALVRVARGTDFGPFPGASQRTIKRSAEKWQQWLALQHGASSETLDKATAKRAKPATLEMVPLILVNEGKPALASGVMKSCDELVNAKGDEQMAAITRLRDDKNSNSTEVLALAIPKLSGDIQQQARDFLIERLKRLSSSQLGDKLQDDNPEVRSAAALAIGRKIAKERIADLLQLLDDPEMAVVQSARVALTELSGEDFGPTSDTDRRGYAEAVAAWHKWWKERQTKKP